LIMKDGGCWRDRTADIRLV